MSSSSSTTLKWTNVSYGIERKSSVFHSGKRIDILHEISGKLCPGEFIALLGPSGCGKTTLMNALAGRLTDGHLTGEITINNQPRDRSWLQMAAVVEQSTIFLQHVTVKEAIVFASFLRLPRDLPVELKMQRVNEVLTTLGLSKCANTMISNVSGGEKKRAAIAIEIITSPSFIFLDEPTSGLDAFNALSLVECVATLCRQEQKAVLMTIHQPRELIMQHFTSIILMSQGSIVFHGTLQDALVHFSSAELYCPTTTNPCDFLIDNITVDNRTQKLRLDSVEKVIQLTKLWKIHEEQVNFRVTSVTEPRKPVGETDSEYWKARAPFHLQYLLLLTRYLTDYRRFKDAVYALIAQTLTLSIFVSVLFWQMGYSQASIQNRMGLLFFLVAQLTFAFTMPISVSLPAECQMIRHERQNMSYKTLAAYLAKITSVIPQAVASTVILGSIVYWATGLSQTFSQFLLFLLTLTCLSLTSQAFGMIIGSLVPSMQVAMIVAPMAVLLLVVFAGSMLNASSIPIALRWIQYISPPAYAYKALMNNEFVGLTFDCYNVINLEVPCFKSGQQVIEYYNLQQLEIWLCILLICIIMIVFHFIGYLAIRMKTRPRGKL